MTKKFDQEQLVALEELLVSNTVQLDTITQLLVEKGVFTKNEFFDMLKQIQKEFKKKNND
jgi:mannitol/fructose-specific phosphotransferase system IIA component (Ntr-type)